MAGPRQFLDAVFRRHWLAVMSGAFSVPFGALAVFSDTKFGQIIWVCLAIAAAWLAAYQVWKVEREQVLKLEEQLRPKITLVNATAALPPQGMDRVLEIEIRNDSGEELNNCLAKVVGIRAIRRSGASRHDEDDMSSIYLPHLPLALRTTRNFERGGGGPFHLRAGETKKIQIASRSDGTDSALQIFYEDGKPKYMYQIPSMKFCELDIAIYGAKGALEKKILLSVSNDRDMARLLVTFDGQNIARNRSQII
jgi:hypothetical protein